MILRQAAGAHVTGMLWCVCVCWDRSPPTPRAPPQVTLAPRATTSNYDATWITQSYSEDERPLSAHGLHGSGMVLAEADSGLDYFSCFFYDSEVEVTFDNQGLYRDKVGGDLGSGIRRKAILASGSTRRRRASLRTDESLS